MNKKAQQEMVGFILIVVLVIIIGMVFLIISLNKQQEVRSNIEIDSMIDVIFATKTSCAIGYIPNYDSVKDLIRSAYLNKKCVDGVSAYSALNSSLDSIMQSISDTETGFESYRLEIIERDEKEEELFLVLENNKSCVSGISGGQRVISGGGVDLVVRVRVC